MKTKRLIAFMMIFISLLSCKKEEFEQDGNSQTNFTSKVIDITGVSSYNEVIKPFKGEDIEIKVNRLTSPALIFDEQDGLIEIEETEVRVSAYKNCGVVHGRPTGPCTVEKWVFGESVSEPLGYNYRIAGKTCYFSQNNTSSQYALFSCEMDGTTKYGWIKIEEDKIEIVLSKNPEEGFEIGVKK